MKSVGEVEVWLGHSPTTEPPEVAEWQKNTRGTNITIPNIISLKYNFEK